MVTHRISMSPPDLELFVFFILFRASASVLPGIVARAECLIASQWRPSLSHNLILPN